MDATPPPVLLLAAGGADSFTGLPGWTARRGFDLGPEPWDRTADRLVCVGIVDDDTAPAALEALARGAALAIEVAARGATRHRFLDDLHKLSTPVAHEPAADPAVDALTPTQRDLLDALAGGATVTAAASDLHLSRRTANRALADARARLGTASTAAAVRRWVEARPPT